MQALNIEFIKPFKTRKGLKAYLSNDVQAFKLYDTLILSKNEKFIQLNTGGFKTNHTKNCMNDNLPEGYSVYQEKFTWYVREPNGGSRTFEDEMVITL